MDELVVEAGVGREDVLAWPRVRLLMAVAALTGFGVIMIYSASAIRAARGGGWEMSYAWNQLSWLVVAVTALLVLYRVPYGFWRRLWPPILVVSTLLLALVLTQLGTRVNGANRWFRWGSLNMQPSELAKIGMIISVAAVLAGAGDGRPRFFRHVLPLCAASGLAVALIAMEPDFGTAALLAATLGILMLAGGARAWQLALPALPTLPAAAWYGLTHYDHIGRRLEAWLDGSSFHTNVSKLALGSGGLWGVGLGQGPAKLDYLPESHTDFIFALAGQETGFVGALSIIALFLVIVWQGMAIAARARDRFGSLLAFGVTVAIGGQALFNLGVVTGLLPPKGISLPFVSSGGSGLVVFYSMAGLLASVSASAPAAARLENSPAPGYRPFPSFRSEMIGGGEKPA